MRTAKMLWTVMIPPTSAQQTIGEGYGRPPTIARTLRSAVPVSR
jgi:hypothetical protein